MPQVTLLGEICVTNDSIFMFSYPYSNKRKVLHNCLKPCSFVLLFCLFTFSDFSAILCRCHLFGIGIHILFAPFIYCQSLLFLHSTSMSPCLYPEAKCPAVFPGWPAPSISSGSVSLCTFSLVMLSDREISHSIRLKRSRSPDKASAEGASSPRCSICWLRLAPCLSTHNICISLSFYFSFFSLSLCTLPQTHPISYFLSTIRITYLFSSPLQPLLILLSTGYLQQML